MRVVRDRMAIESSNAKPMKVAVNAEIHIGDRICAAYAKVRKFIRDNAFNGDDSSGAVDPPLHVRVTGQLFFDLFHPQDAKDTGGRGKKAGSNPMQATTIWKIHPITEMTLVDGAEP